MAISDHKIKESDYTGRDVVSAPDRLTGTPRENKLVFDRITKQVVIPALNALIDELTNSGAASVGTSVSGVTGTDVQTVLEGLKALIDDRYTKEQSDGLLGDKADKTAIAPMLADMTIDENGVITITRKNGTTKSWDTALEKIAVNFDFNPERQKLTLTLEDGTKKEVDLSAFVKPNEFVDSANIDFTTGTDGTVTATIRAGSVTDEMLDSAIKEALIAYRDAAAASAAAAQASENNTLTYKQAAETARTGAEKAQTEAEVSEINAEVYAEGGTPVGHEGELVLQEELPGAKGYMLLAQQYANNAATSASAADRRANAAAESERKSGDSETNAAASAQSASESASAAQASKTAAEAAKAAAAVSESAAKTSETNAAASKTAAAASASAAKTSESNAALSASQAADSASSASGSAEEAANSADAASASESATEAAKNAAQASEAAAKASETASKASETAAKASETASKQSETSAAGSASAAQESASNAADSATAAAQSAASIGDAEQVVTQKAAEASASAESADQSAEAAARSAEQAAEVVGGNFATKSEAQGYADTAESNAKKYADQQIAAIPTPDVPTKVSELENDSGYLTSYTETDPTVPAWAKAASKPSYTKGEVGLGNVDNVKQYSASNPPPYPVTSVNGQTGAVTVQSGSETNSYTATLLSNGWATYGKYKKQTVTVTGLKESYPIAPVVDAQLSGVDADGDAEVLTAFAAVNIVQTAEDQLIAYCIGDAPSTNIPLIINTWG